MSKPAKPAAESWWRENDDLRCGRVSGRIISGGWRWKVSSEGAIWLWLNREGSGLVWGERDRFILKPGMYAMTGGGKTGDWSCLRYPGIHALEVVVISREWFEGKLGKKRKWLHPELGSWLENGGPVAFCGLMGGWERDLCDALAQAAEGSGSSRLLAEARVLEWAAVRLFRGNPGNSGGEGFCATRRDLDPVTRAITLLRERLGQPLDLAEIARDVGLPPRQLSQRVNQETGKTLQHHLRRLRIERAREVLASGKSSVMEAAIEVGYRSLSHFAKAFREETGFPPKQWLMRAQRETCATGVDVAHAVGEGHADERLDFGN